MTWQRRETTLGLATILGLGVLACSSSAPLKMDAGPRPDAAAGTAGATGGAGTAGAAGSGASGATGTAGVGGTAGAAAGATGTAGVTGTAGAAAGATGTAGVTAGTAGVTGTAGAAGAAGASRDVDVLFMIDNSSSMTALQQKLIASFPTYVDALKAQLGELPNLHIAVVSSSLGAGQEQGIYQCPVGGDQGLFQTKPLGATCDRATLAQNQSFIIASSGGNNFTGDLADMFSCIALLGSSGCGFEHQLASVVRALGADGFPAPAQNAGFLRVDALLQVVLLTNEDDCSAPPNTTLFSQSSQLVSDPLGPLQSYRCNEFGHLCGGQPPPRKPLDPPVDLSGTCVSAEDGRLLRVGDVVNQLKAVKSDPSKILVSVIAGPSNPYIVNTGPASLPDPSPWPFIEHSCVSADGTYADPGVRLTQWTNAFGSNGLYVNICGDDIGLDQAAAQLAHAL